MKISLVRDDDQVMVITDGGQIIRTRVGEIREAGRNTQGVRIIRLADGEKVVDVEAVGEVEDDESNPPTSIPPTSIPPEPSDA